MMRVDEIIRPNDIIVSVNPTREVFLRKHKGIGGGIIAKNGVLVVGDGVGYSVDHYTIFLASKVRSEEKYRLQLFPSKAILELWDDLDSMPEDVVTETPAQYRKAAEQYTKYPRPIRDTIAAEVLSNRNFLKLYPNPRLRIEVRSSVAEGPKGDGVLLFGIYPKKTS